MPGVPNCIDSEAQQSITYTIPGMQNGATQLVPSEMKQIFSLLDDLASVLLCDT
jgi:hypothetical protein